MGCALYRHICNYDRAALTVGTLASVVRLQWALVPLRLSCSVVVLAGGLYAVVSITVLRQVFHVSLLRGSLKDPTAEWVSEGLWLTWGPDEQSFDDNKAPCGGRPRSVWNPPQICPLVRCVPLQQAETSRAGWAQ